MTTTSSGSSAASAAEAPCGRARKTTSWPASVSGVVSSRTWSASGCRCGCTAPRRVPAFEAAVSAPIRRSGWPSSSRRISPPAYPLAPATAAVTMRMNIHTTQFLCRTGSAQRVVRTPQVEPEGAVVGADPAGGLRPQRGGGVGAGTDIAPGPRVELARAQRQQQVGHPLGGGPLGAADVRPHALGHLRAHDTGRQVERTDAELPAGLVQAAGQPGEGRLARAVRREVAPLAEARTAG